jgi:hypothetical protein
MTVIRNLEMDIMLPFTLLLSYIVLYNADDILSFDRTGSDLIQVTDQNRRLTVVA